MILFFTLHVGAVQCMLGIVIAKWHIVSLMFLDWRLRSVSGINNPRPTFEGYSDHPRGHLPSHGGNVLTVENYSASAGNYDSASWDQQSNDFSSYTASGVPGELYPSSSTGGYGGTPDICQPQRR